MSMLPSDWEKWSESERKEWRINNPGWGAPYRKGGEDDDDDSDNDDGDAYSIWLYLQSFSSDDHDSF